MTIVPNKFPTRPSDRRIAIIGEAPGQDEITLGEPFVGTSGRFLAALLSRAGVSRDTCFFGNVSQHRPYNNDISLFNWTGDEIQHGMYQLKSDIATFKPNIVVLLGNVALKAAKDPDVPHILKPNSFRFKNSQWRGSLFLGEPKSPFAGLKCISSYHPAYCLRDYEATPLLMFDLRKAARESLSPLLVLPKRTLETKLTRSDIVLRLQGIRRDKKIVALDIEGGIDTMSCISFATSPLDAFIIPINDDTPWRELAQTLEDPYVPKVLQNALYDSFVLHYSYGIRTRNIVDDTMLKHWELYSELEKSLGVQTSLYTNEPYYKSERKSDDDETFYRYCCKDSAVTLEINQALEPLIKDCSREHYELNVDLLHPMLYMELRGIRYDIFGAHERREIIRQKLFEAQAKFNGLTGHGFSFKSRNEILNRIKDLMLVKKGDRPYAKYQESYPRARELVYQRSPTLATVGELEDLCEVSLNVDSPKQFPTYLYETLKLPTQYKIVKGKEDTTSPTSDYEALLKLSRWCIQNNKPDAHRIVTAAMEIRALGTRQQMLSIGADKDGRIRCGYNLVGSNTGRVTCYESPTGSGYNLQTIPNYTVASEAPGNVLGDRDLFISDEDSWLFQCDLAGADGWTVAAYCAMLGDNNMLDDYRASIKPYAKIALKIAGKELDFKDRTAVKSYLATYKLGEVEKLMAKRVQHGGAYLEGGLTISRNILKDSEGKVYLPPAECDKLKNWYIYEQYPGIPRWHDWVARRLKERPVLTAASGQVRQFFGRPDEIITKAVAFEPQANTTYATNLAAHRLWRDPDNRIKEGYGKRSLRVEPLHQVHDALIGGFRKTDTSWAVEKIRGWFENVLLIAGQKIIIPFEGKYGKSWGNLEEGTI